MGWVYIEQHLGFFAQWEFSGLVYRLHKFYMISNNLLRHVLADLAL